jgi:hypothetical protein
MRVAKVSLLIAVTAALPGCANRRAAFGALTGAAAAAAILGCAASNGQNNCTPEVKPCPSGFVHDVDGRCHLVAD